MSISTHLKLPYLQAAQAQKYVTHNEALHALDAIVQLSVLDRDIASPPGSPAAGDRYLVASGPSGAWTGHASHVAAWQDGAWAFYVPQEGWLAWVADEDVLLSFGGSSWSPIGSEQLAKLGINATADTTNRLAVSSAAILFNHAGDGVQLKLNKDGAADTASILFQTGFSGRAEMGTTGDDDFHFKVSPDGAAFHEAILIDKDTGAVSLPATPKPIESLMIACSDETTALTAGTKVAFRMPYAFALVAVRASLATAQASGALFTIDVNESGASILSTKLTIDNGEKTSATAAAPAVVSDAALADDAEITIDVDQVGNGSAKGLKVTLIGRQL